MAWLAWLALPWLGLACLSAWLVLANSNKPRQGKPSKPSQGSEVPIPGTMFLVKLPPEACHGFKSRFDTMYGCRMSILVPATYSQGLEGPPGGQNSKKKLEVCPPTIHPKTKSKIFPEVVPNVPGVIFNLLGKLFWAPLGPSFI